MLSRYYTCICKCRLCLKLNLRSILWSLRLNFLCILGSYSIYGLSLRLSSELGLGLSLSLSSVLSLLRYSLRSSSISLGTRGSWFTFSNNLRGFRRIFGNRDIECEIKSSIKLYFSIRILNNFLSFYGFLYFREFELLTLLQKLLLFDHLCEFKFRFIKALFHFLFIIFDHR